MQRYWLSSIQVVLYWWLSILGSVKGIPAEENVARRRTVAANDRCANAVPIPLNANVSIDFTGATSDGEVDIKNVDCIQGSPPRAGLWYTFVGTGERLVARSGDVCPVEKEVSLSIFKGGCDTLNVTYLEPTNFTSTCVTSLRDFCFYGRTFWNTESGTTYQVLVQSLPFTERVDFSIQVAPPVPNERCTNATSILIGSTVYADVRFSMQADADNPRATGLWYSFVGTGERLVGRAGEYCKTSMSIYRYLYNTTCDPNWRPLAFSDNLCSDQRFFFDTEPGTTYYVYIQSSIFAVIVDFSIFVPPPVANDQCGKASPIVFGSTVYDNFTYAMLNRSEVYTDCIRVREYVLPLPRPRKYKGLWYTFQGTGGHLVGQFGQVCNTTDASSTVMSIYGGDCFGGLYCVGAEDRICEGETFVFATKRGRTYHVLVQSTADEVLVDFSISRCGLLSLGPPCPNGLFSLFVRLIRNLFGS
jgi:hypothetical protein